MKRTCWWLVDILSRTLEPGEREVVLGDFAECGETGGQAIRDVAGLIVRRQAALWKDWRPWVVLLGLIMPLGMMLSIVSRFTAGRTSTYTWLYLNNWDWALLRYKEFWYELVSSIAFVLVQWLTLVCWSWTAGFALGAVSRRMMNPYGVLFSLMLMFGGLVAAPLYVAYWVQSIGRPPLPDERDPISALQFYRVMFPLIVQVALVLVPSLWGMRQGAHVGVFPRRLRIALWTAAISTLILLLVQEPGFVFFLRASWLPRIWQSRQVRVLQFVVYWPAGYLLANAVWRRLHRNTAA